MSVIQFWVSHRAELTTLLAQHVALVAAAVVTSVLLGVPLGILAAKRRGLGAPLLALANIVQTIPSLAMFGFLIPVPVVGGIGARAAFLVLVLYGLLPVIRTTVTGLTTIDRAILEAGTAMGMTPRQLLALVELPLAAPSIVAGVRVAAVVGVGTATIAAAIGAGGLGEYIFRGLSMIDPTVMLAGAIPAAALALVADGALAGLERFVAPARRRSARARVAAASTLGIVAVGLAAVALTASAERPLRIGSKNFTEQLVLGELLAQTIERYAALAVERRLNLGGTFICDRAVAAGEIDGYVEYTGTALTAIFHQPVSGTSRDVLERVRQIYARSGRTVLPPLGFNNTFAILVRGGDARQLGLRTIEDAARHAEAWRAGFGYEFIERADGLQGLARTYALRFARPPRVMDLALIYRALAAGQVDLIAGDATNGLIDALDLVMLEDNRSYFPPYDAVPVMRTAVLQRHPQLRAAIDRLAGRISARDMRAMNHAVDARHRDVTAVVREFLQGL
ncbi:MAG: ABC transporter permease subunit [Acidobacteria bacterium]|nr:ABC transporter permease subunit [Acidobacteriota bacterium]